MTLPHEHCVEHLLQGSTIRLRRGGTPAADRLPHHVDPLRRGVERPVVLAAAVDLELLVHRVVLEDEQRREGRHHVRRLAQRDHCLAVLLAVLGAEPLDLEPRPLAREVASAVVDARDLEQAHERLTIQRARHGHEVGQRVAGRDTRDGRDLLAVPDGVGEGEEPRERRLVSGERLRLRPNSGVADADVQEARRRERRRDLERAPRQRLRRQHLREQPAGACRRGPQEWPGPAVPDSDAHVRRAGGHPVDEARGIPLPHHGDAAPDVHDHRVLGSVDERLRRVERCAEVERSDEMRRLQEPQCGSDVLARRRHAFAGERLGPTRRRQHGQRVARLRLGEDAAHDLDLRPREHGVAVAGGLEEHDPVAALVLRRGRQVRSPTEEQVARALVLDGVEPRRCGARRRREVDDHVAVEQRALRARTEQQIVARVLRAQRRPFSRPGEVGAARDARRERPRPREPQGVPGGEAVRRLPVRRRQPLHVREQDALLLARLQREHAHLEGAPVDPLQQRRVAARVPDLLVDVARPVPLRHAAFHQASVHVHRQARERRVGWQREVERALHAPRRVVEVRLVDRGPRETVLDVHVHVETPEREAHLLSRRVDGEDRAAGVLARRHERRLRRGHEVAHPRELVRRARRRLDARLGLASRDEPLAAPHERAAAHLHGAVGDEHLRRVGPDAHSEARAHGREFAIG